MAARDRFLGGRLAASTLVTVPRLVRPEWLLEISIVAAPPDDAGGAVAPAMGSGARPRVERARDERTPLAARPPRRARRGGRLGTTGTAKALGPDDATALGVGAMRILIGAAGLVLVAVVVSRRHRTHRPCDRHRSSRAADSCRPS